MLKAAPFTFTLMDFSLGLDWTAPPDSMDLRCVRDAKNINLTSTGALEKRKGMELLYPSAYLGPSPEYLVSKVRDLYEYRAPNGTDYLVVACGAQVGYYTGSAWADFKTGLSTTARYGFATHQGYCFVGNGTDANFKIRDTTVTGVGIVPPAAKPAVAAGALTGLTGDYKYVYAYKRVTEELIGNYSPISDLISPSNGSNSVTVAESSDSQVTKILLYRTLDLVGSTVDPVQYYKVTELNNSDQSYDDNNADNALTTLAKNTNTVPPKAKFFKVFNDRMMYANCPAETNGGSLFMYSKSGRAEACPSTQYHYFDRDDGEEITGHAVFSGYYVVFKRNKIGVLAGGFSEWYTISVGIGCIAPWAIIELADKVIFLSEEGWKSFDGVNIVDVSKRLLPLVRAKYFTPDEGATYSATYYPDKKQMQFLLNHSSYTDMVMIGHWLEPLLMEAVPEERYNPYVGWTYHQYDNHILTCLGSYTDATGITRIVAGDSNGFVYKLDSTQQDGGNDIAIKIETAWFPLSADRKFTKTLRFLNISYAATASPSITVYTDIDHTNAIDTNTLTDGKAASGGYPFSNVNYQGFPGMQDISLDAKGTGKLFRFRFEDTSNDDFVLTSIGGNFRIEGLR